jgi:3-phenylpropionate/trans-cinnamate dioxygenase ferredoxin subunit
MPVHSLSPDRVPPDGERRYLFLGDTRVILFNLGGKLHAVDDSCPHHGASLYAGKLTGSLLRCPAHAMTFDVTTGEQSGGGLCLSRHQVVQSGDQVDIIIADDCPPA